MKKLGLALGLMLAQLTALPAISQTALPESGTYFIVNCKTDQAVQPLAVTPGNNVFANEFNKGGTQKFTLTRKVDPATKKPTNRYTIKSANEEVTLYLAPHPVAERTAWMDGTATTYALKPADSGLIVESVARNGDAMYPLNVPPCTELRFGPNDNSDKFKWKFVPVQ